MNQFFILYSMGGKEHLRGFSLKLSKCYVYMERKSSLRTARNNYLIQQRTIEAVSLTLVTGNSFLLLQSVCSSFSHKMKQTHSSLRGFAFFLETSCFSKTDTFHTIQYIKQVIEPSNYLYFIMTISHKAQFTSKVL